MKIVEIKKITDDNFELIICEKLKGILNREEALDLMDDLAEHLGYETRGKW